MTYFIPNFLAINYRFTLIKSGRTFVRVLKEYNFLTNTYYTYNY